MFRIRMFAASALVLSLIAPAAQALDDGAYDVVVDGGQGTIRLDGSTFSIGVGARGCSGGGEGMLYRAEGTDQWIARLSSDQDGQVNSCVITGDGGSFGAGPGCSYFHGARCGFSGQVSGPHVAMDIQAIDQVGGALGDVRLKEVQRSLSETNHYNGAIDGVYGPGTRGAMLDMARAMAGEGDVADLSTEAGIRAFIDRLVPDGTSVEANEPEAQDPEEAMTSEDPDDDDAAAPDDGDWPEAEED